MDFYIRKASGERELFDLKKLSASLEKAGAHEKTIANILDEIKKEKPKSSQAIHKAAIQLLQQQEPHIADRYNLKQALMELGPDGYSFEKYIGELFAAQGFKTAVSQIVQGTCVSHEIDVVAEKDADHFMIEAKFHNRGGLKSDVQVPLYVQARFEDVRDAWEKNPRDTHQKIHVPWIVTNTKFTSEAIKYGECKGMKLIGWNYPAQGNLAQLIQKYNLFPITTLTSLSKKQKRLFIQEGFVMCKHAKEQTEALKKIGLSAQHIKRIIAESEAVCKI